MRRRVSGGRHHRDLTTDLARIPGLFVTSRNAAFTYKGKDVNPPAVAAELGVRHILEGSIRRVGDDLRINAQLIDAESGGHLWAERFDGTFADVITLQNKVLTNIAAAMELHFTPNEKRSAGGTSNPAAYDAYLHGLELFRRHWRSDTAAADLKKAIDFFEQAIALIQITVRPMADWRMYICRRTGFMPRTWGCPGERRATRRMSIERRP